MNAYTLPNGHLLIPRRAEGPNGLIGDGMVEIGPDDPDFERWLPFAKPEEKADLESEPEEKP